MASLAASRRGASLFRWLLPRADRLALRLTRGRRVFTNHAVPTLILTSIGRKSGEPRLQPLCYVRDGNDLIVVGSNWGQEHHPAWTANLLATPRATVTIGGDELPVEAELVPDDEWESLYGRFEAMSRNYAAYRQWTGGRRIRMFRLTPR
ncbi:MAG: nitroreductase family deazaflavin-dependent oxidoreductase [Actinomycetota bacterium]|nr:nitroreductase family deazaflavin-dependent oxidoreductase [Actinomycetota bacterium]